MIQRYIQIPEEQEEFYQYLNDYIKKTISEEYQNTEHVVSEEIIYKHIQNLIEFGLIYSPVNKENEYSIWNYYQKNILISIISLLELGIVNGGLSYITHQYSLFNYCLSYIKEHYNQSFEFPFWILLQGNYGLARNLLAKYLFSQEDKELYIQNLKHYFELPESFILQIPDFFEYFSFFNINDQNIQKNNLNFNIAKIQSKKLLNPSHGLEEIKTYEIEYNTIISIPVDISLYIDLFSKQLLGNLSIATGRLVYAFQKALKYTNERIQGGKLIYNYPAIQNLLFNADSTIEIALNSLFACNKLSFDKDLFLKVLRIKKQLMPLILQGVSDCLQTHGGYGYMRDYGLEKAYRDVNHLKQYLGTSFEISLFLAEVYKHKQSNLQII
ncbi:MAG: hypothetical protein KatS3mg129_2975 [Leptospiraceae bacterium]|nr:MAG: hypothetical protein KatS3mg129_2975 [Leptospiraceae bacterium]